MRSGGLGSAAIVGIFAIATFLLAGNAESTQPRSALAEGGGPEMSLNVLGGACDDLVQPSECFVAIGADFTVSVDATFIPESGYILAQSWVEYGGDLVYHKRTAVEETSWPDCPTTYAINDNFPAAHFNGCLTGLPPLPPSFHAGSMFELAFSCSPTASATDLELVPYGEQPADTNGALFNTPPSGDNVIPKVGDLSVVCVDPIVDTDGDGCPDLLELGLDQTKGGLRDPADPWDFYDTNGDRIVDLANDILGVIEHYAPQGQPPYDVAYDRGPQSGPNPWDMTAPDGAIDLANDVLGVIQQYLHDCR